MKSIHSNTSGCVRRLLDGRTSMQKPNIRYAMCTLSNTILDDSRREKFTWWTGGNMVGD